MAVSLQSEQEHSLPAPPERKLLPESTSGGSPSRKGSWIRVLILTLVLLAAAAFAYWKYTGNKKEDAATAAKATAAANRAIPVSTAPVVSKTMPIYLTALGTVTAYNTVTVKSRVDGQLLSVNVREGQRVSKGQTLAMIDPRPYEAIVAQGQGQLAKDQAAADLAKAEAGRYDALYKAGVVSKESQQTQASTAGASVGTLQADRAAIQAARVNVSYTRITSPINGVVGLRQVDAGNIVKASDANGLLVVTQLQPIAVIFTLPEDHLPDVLKRIRGGSKLTVEAYDRTETKKLAIGTLLTVDNQIDTTTGTLKAKAVFDNSDGALFPNQFVNIRLILEQRQDSLVIPAAGLQQGSQGNFVYVVKPGAPPKQPNDEADADTTAKAPPAAGSGTQPRRPPFYVETATVQVDLTEGSQVILKSGVAAGQQIVIDGQEKLRPFSKVDPRPGTPTTRINPAAQGNDAAQPPTPGARSQQNTQSNTPSATGIHP